LIGDGGEKKLYEKIGQKWNKGEELSKQGNTFAEDSNKEEELTDNNNEK
jgi:hypothetical protein